ncbi:MAG TPA: hypothetical protein VNA21_10725 [Steroidobacteraceae bacterium]|nr:hypothetical protein [Steroidobacteraceae bacterium]
MVLPLLLAGPIVRRVEPSLAAVWIALSEPASVSLKLFDGRISAQDAGTPLLTSEAPASTLRVGDKLHIALALIKIPQTSPQLQPNRIYSYDLDIKVGDSTHTLNSLGLLTSGTFEGRKVLPLGYEELILPGFALPPEELTDLRVLFGSCRRPGNTHQDAMTLIDDLMDTNPDYSVKDPLKRPHQLFLGGDQIYADDVTDVHSHLLIDLGKELIGKETNGTPREHLMVDSIRKAMKPVAQVTALSDYGEPITRVTTPAPDATDFQLPADHASFPAGRRSFETLVEAQMTTTGSSHLYGFGEFAAMYLTVWSNACWPRDATTPFAIKFPTDDELATPQWAERLPTWIAAPLNAIESRDEELTGEARALSPFHSGSNRSPRDAAALPAHLTNLRASHAGQRRILTTFEEGLAKIRRVLANIPTYMMFDDHDVTDDWNLNPAWYDRVYGTSLGVTMARNALLNYALFQDWGNDPLKYEKGDYKKLLDHAAKLFPANTKGPDLTPGNAIDKLFGFHLRGKPSPAGRVAPVNPAIKWHFNVPGPKHLAVALDNRTRRSFVSRNGPPGNVASIPAELEDTTAQTEQIPAGPFTDGKEVLLVIAPLQVIGPPLLDELVAPAAYRAFDALSYSKKLDPKLKFGSRLMAGTDPDAIEAWSFDAETIEALFKRVEPYRQVVFLSGDVHYSASSVLSYFTKGNADPARFVQFTSSGFKNVMPEYITIVDRSISTAHKLVRADIGAERLGWLSKPEDPIELPAGKSEKDIPRELRARLRHEPTMLPTYGWPKDSKLKTSEMPDWSWRVEPVFDVREIRPDGIKPRTIDEADVASKLKVTGGTEVAKGYLAVVSKHQHALSALRNSRQILFRSNFGAVRFRKVNGVLLARHEMYTTSPAPHAPGEPEPKPECFVLHEVPMSTPGAKRPESKLQPLKAQS